MSDYLYEIKKMCGCVLSTRHNISRENDHDDPTKLSLFELIKKDVQSF